MKIKKNINRLLETPTNGSPQIIILRLMAGGVFFCEGILKFVFTNLGTGRFTKLGFLFPAETAHFIAVMEIAGGLLLICGLFTRIVSILFVIEMIVAILSTKISLFMGTYPLALPPSPPQSGIWAVLHEIRSEYAQLLTCLFLIFVGPGRFSLDHKFAKK